MGEHFGCWNKYRLKLLFQPFIQVEGVVVRQAPFKRCLISFHTVRGVSLDAVITSQFCIVRLRHTKVIVDLFGFVMIGLFVAPLAGCIEHPQDACLPNAVFTDNNIDSIAEIYVEAIAGYIPMLKYKKICCLKSFDWHDSHSPSNVACPHYLHYSTQDYSAQEKMPYYQAEHYSKYTYNLFCKS